MPSVSIDATTKQTQVTNIKCEMYIHERAKGRPPGAPSRHKKGVKQGVGRRRGLGEEEEEDEEEASYMDVTEVVSKTNNFVIVGVIDPRSKQEISVYQAINKVSCFKSHFKTLNPTMLKKKGALIMKNQSFIFRYR